MTAALDRERLARVLGMLGSDHPGEVVAAARQAERLRADAGVTWAEIIVTALPRPTRRDAVETIADAIEFVLNHEDDLTHWERDFVRSISRQNCRPSPKQIEVLERLVEKVRRAAARTA